MTQKNGAGVPAGRAGLSRRAFLKWSAALGAMVASANTLRFGLKKAEAVQPATLKEGKWIPVACWGDCGSQWACPYGAPQLNPTTGVMQKCDMCKDLQDAGEPPACVGNCPMRCLDYGELEELRAKYGDVDSIMPLPSGEITRPAFVVTPPKSPHQGAGGRIRDVMEA
nr:hypothetical protein [Bacillota bacterium]